MLSTPKPSVAPPALSVDSTQIKPYSQDDEDYYSQAGELFRLMSETQQQRLTDTIADSLSAAAPGVQRRILDYLAKADANYAVLVEQKLS